MAYKKFLESHPLYKKFDTGLQTTWREQYMGPPIEEKIYMHDIPKPAINLKCARCNSIQTFNINGEYEPGGYAEASGSKVTAEYRCDGCKISTQHFFLRFFYESASTSRSSRNLWVEKIGQYPSWNKDIEPDLESLLGHYVQNFKRGLANESISYGIGAYAYYRQIIENIIDELLDSVESLLSGENKEKYAEALAKTKTTRITEEKIKLVEDLLPDSLMVEGTNPLKVLHEALSEDLHNGDDESSLEAAESIRNVLVYLVHQITHAKRQAKAFSEGMKSLLEKKSERLAKKNPPAA